MRTYNLNEVEEIVDELNKDEKEKLIIALLNEVEEIVDELNKDEKEKLIIALLNDVFQDDMDASTLHKINFELNSGVLRNIKKNLT